MIHDADNYRSLDDYRSDDLHPTPADFGWAPLPTLRERRTAAEAFHEPYLRAHGLAWPFDQKPGSPPGHGRDDLFH